MKKRILLVIGTRPEAIKMAPVYHALSARDDFAPEVVLTGQHDSLPKDILDFFKVPITYELSLNRTRFDLAELTSQVIVGLRDVYEQAKPDVVLVHGDTTSSFSGALAAYYSQIKIGHVEAGLRTYDPYAPFPEEKMRYLTAGLATWHFAPTAAAKKALLVENLSPDTIFQVGNTVIDALLWTAEKINQDKMVKSVVESELAPYDFDVEKPFILITGHRRENFGQGFLDICHQIKKLAEEHKDYNFVYPLHLNPNVKKPVESMLGQLENLHLLAPVNYPTFIYLMQHSYLIISDSGGIQEEAPSFQKPVLVMRSVTERPEAVHAGTAKLVGTTSIYSTANELINSDVAYKKMISNVNPYGDGCAAKRIADILARD